MRTCSRNRPGANRGVRGGAGFDTGFTATFQASQSSSATITSLSASPVSPSTHQPVNLAANVLPSAAIGTVNFMDGAALLGSATLTNGQATLTVGPLTAANHSLTALYAGGIRFASSMSAPFNESVSASPLSGT